MPYTNFAASRQVNPPGASPKLTEEQVWVGHQMKVRNPHAFTPAITSCNVTADEGDKVVRTVRFRQEDAVEETIQLYNGTIAYFDTPSGGMRVTNVLSYDKDNELVLTYSFANVIPGIHSLGASPSAADVNKSIGVALEGTIEKIRELVKEGVIKV